MFTGKINQKDLYTLYKNSKVLIMVGEEDFGITALEAGIFGKPVVVFYTSGVSEILIENKHAVYLNEESVSQLTYALGKIDSLEFDANELRLNALKYSKEQFKTEFIKQIELELKGQYVIS
jgi:glycosyltransferase involved in cell wall biosynthesis